MSKLDDNELARCLPVHSLMSLAGDALPEPDEFSATVKGVCRFPPCRDSLVRGLQADLRAQCSSNIQSGEYAQTFRTALYILDNYAPLRNATCVQSKEGGLCAAETYTKIYPSAKNTPHSQLLEKIPPNELCSECNKGIVTVLLQADRARPGKLLDASTAKNVSARISDTCGKDYLDGNTNTISGDQAHATSSGTSLMHYAYLAALPVMTTTAAAVATIFSVLC
ncbi:hypothetical protein SYNPS1DRAFT_29640 [Syncephalis pseudoplumigaleata]|uniref:DUF7729 domain-containing protein n=1 Tax=Syncephalis pseudoplumigaleata TaxID=1712513 RepID=A0A4P9YX16_9FUNG|nr:hypothetical protein SYNPS1DRAFT_29640 [Syncephalis pseudoplumigaleata]|eukprot:RKP24597.1 hypothetical protein SYNPS1DRAFT_29640 [Syncephalis pseudoplumigaleata]